MRPNTQLGLDMSKKECMKRETEQRKDAPGHVSTVHYLQTGDTALYKPYADQNGIHCTGDRFGYIVDWQVTERKTSRTDKVAH